MPIAKTSRKVAKHPLEDVRLFDNETHSSRKELHTHVVSIGNVNRISFMTINRRIHGNGYSYVNHCKLFRETNKVQKTIFEGMIHIAH